MRKELSAVLLRDECGFCMKGYVSSSRSLLRRVLSTWKFGCSGSLVIMGLNEGEIPKGDALNLIIAGIRVDERLLNERTATYYLRCDSDRWERESVLNKKWNLEALTYKNNFAMLFKYAVRGKAMSNAFKAFKAQVPIAWSPNLYITLARGMPVTRRLHRRTLEALRLRKCNRTVTRWNTPTLRGMLQQVKRLVIIQTEEMYKARKETEAQHKALRPPLIINHSPPATT